MSAFPASSASVILQLGLNAPNGNRGGYQERPKPQVRPNDAYYRRLDTDPLFVSVRQIGLGLAAAVLVDATLVRLVR